MENKIYINCDGFNFVDDKAYANRTLTIDELLTITDNLYMELSRQEEINEELEDKIEELKEEIDKLNEDIKDYYNPKSPYEVYGMSERDFI